MKKSLPLFLVLAISVACLNLCRDEERLRFEGPTLETQLNGFDSMHLCAMEVKEFQRGAILDHFRLVDVQASQTCQNIWPAPSGSDSLVCCL